MAMEGVPRIPMIGFPLKRSADVPDFKSKIKRFISHQYNEDAEAYNQEISNFEALRAGAIHVSRDFTGCATLKKYFCQLNFLKSRFPFQEGSQIATSFSWYDVYSDSVHGWKDIDFEMACILYNVGALHSELGTKDPRINADGMKTSCTHFQCAAWAFQHLKNDYHKYFSPDLTSDVLSVMTNICLAQAQECILEKSLIDNRKSAITAKVSLQIVEYYQQTLKTIDVILKKSSSAHSEKIIKAAKKWRELVETKSYYYGCLSYLYRGLHAEEQSKFGERITFFKAAQEKLNEAIKCAKSMDKSDTLAISETLNFTTDVIGTKLSSSEKENEFVYHEKVPELDAVDSDFKGVSLVKGIPFKFDDPEISGPDIFARLVPMEAHEKSSVYSELKANLLRSYSSKIEEKNEALERFLLAMQLDQLDIHAEENRPPQELVDCCAALSVNPEAVKKLAALMSKLSGMFHDVEHNLKEIEAVLKAEDAQEKEYQEIVGKRPPNNLITELSREVKKYQHAHTVASESNQTLHEAMRVHVVNLQILMKPFPEVLKSIPSIADVEERDEAAITEMKRLRSKIDEMRNQRDMLANQLRESILSDDITKSLVVKQDQDLDTVFQDELRKHEKITQLLDQNMIAQDNILRAVTEANAAYATTRKATEEMIKKRNQVIQTLLGSYDAYNELLIKCTQGVEFYTKLDANVSKLLQRVKSACTVQEEEREERTNSILKKAQNVPAADTGYKNYDPSLSNTAAAYSNYNAGADISSRNEAFDNAVLQQQYEKNLALQQQYEKNLALQQEYEKLTKLQQLTAKDSNSHQYNSNYNSAHQYPSQDTASAGQNNYGNQSTVPASYGVGSEAAQYYAAAMSAHPAVTQAGYNNSVSSTSTYPTTTSPMQQYVPNSTYAYATASSQHQTYQYSSPAAPQTYVTNSNMHPYSSAGSDANNVSAGSPQPYSHTTSNYSSSVPSAQQYPPSVPSPQQYVSSNTGSQHYPTGASAAHAYPTNPSSQQYPASTPSALQYPSANATPQYPASTPAAQPYPSSSPSILHYPSSAPTQQYPTSPSPQQYPVSTPSTQQQYPTNTPSVQQYPAHTLSMQAYPSSTADPSSMANQYNQYSNNPLLQQYSQQYGLPSSQQQQQYGSYAILGQQSYQQPETAAAGYGQSTAGHSGGVPLSQQYIPQQQAGSDAGGTGQPSQQQYGSRNMTPHQQQTSTYVHSKLPDSSGNAYINDTSGYSGITGSNTATAWNYTSPDSTNYTVNYPYSADSSGYSNYYNQSAGSEGTDYSSSYVQQQHQSQPQYQQYSQNVNESGNGQGSNVAQSNNVSNGGVPPAPKPVPAASEAKKPFETVSNIDLLAGVDLSLPQPPLQPLTSNSLVDSVVAERVQNNTAVSDNSSMASTKQGDTTHSPVPSNPPAAVASSDERLTETPLSNLLLKKPSLNESRKSVIDHLSDPSTLEKFTKDVENLQHTFEGFYKKSLNGPTNLDIKWKEVMDIQNAASIKMNISVARCYPMKNRYPDILPHDQTRVPLPCTKDDYINASFVRDISASSIPFIATQAPLPVTFSDFWHMIWHHHIELLVCLSSDTDLKEHIYWPLERGKDVVFGPLNISLQSKNVKAAYVERIFCVTHRDLKQTRVTIHLQFKGWPGNVFPDSPGPFLGFITEVHSYFQQQRSLSRPIVVHCLSGVGKTGVFIILSSAIREIQNGKSFPDLSPFAGIASEQRKGIMNDKEYLRFAYQCLLYYCQDLLMKRGILSARSTFDEKPKSSHTRHPSQDFLTEAIKKMKTECEGEENETNNADQLLSNSDSNGLRNTSLPCTPSHRNKSEEELIPSPRARIYSDVPASLMDVEVSTFQTIGQQQLDPTDPKRNNFESRKGALTKKHEITTDPLDTLDPLWTMKK